LESQAVGPPVNSVEMSHGTANWVEIANKINSAKPLKLANNIPTALQTIARAKDGQQCEIAQTVRAMLRPPMILSG